MTVKNKNILFSAHSIQDVKLYISLFKYSDAKNVLLTFRLSSHLFARFNGIKSKTMFHIPLIASIYPSFNWIKDNHYDIDGRLYSSFDANKNYFKKSFYLCQKYIKKHIQPLALDIILLTGEARINEQAIVKSACNSKIVFWEAGPKGQIYFSENGVNANANFSSNKDSLSYKFNQICSPLDEKVATKDAFTIFFKILELIYIYIIKFIFRSNEMNEVLPKINSFFKNNIPINKRPEQYILFIDQVELDVNNTHHGARVEDILKKINKIFKLTKISKPSLKLVRRAHPRQLKTNIANNLSREFKNIYVDSSEGSLEEAISQSFLVMTVNSTGGLDSLLSGMPVYLFGKSYYEDLYGVIKDINLEHYLKEELFLEKELIIKKATSFIDNNFIPIDYRGGSFKYIAKFDNFLNFL